MKKLLQSLGPGLLYAGAAVGVSHLVQSTRAGAEFGYSLVWAVVLANLLKYPFFEIGPRYAAATGNHLLVAYKNQGKFWLMIYLAITLSTMFIVLAAISAVTSGLAITLFQVNVSVSVIGACSLILSAIYLWFSGYTQLDKLVKAIVIILSVATFVAFFLSFEGVARSRLELNVFDWNNELDILFLIALMGWMPAPIDISAWHSLWSVEKLASSRSNPSRIITDFRIGFWGTAILALCFLSLGANLLCSNGVGLEAGSVNFSKQLVQLFTSSIGEWSYPIILIAAFACMLSTTLTCLDAYPRALAAGFQGLSGSKSSYFSYKSFLLLATFGSISVLFLLLSDMRSLVDLATIISFLIAPILAFMNYRAIMSDQIPSEFRYSTLMKLLSYAGLVFLLGFSLYFLWARMFL